jgi:hypothetical protein
MTDQRIASGRQYRSLHVLIPGGGDDDCQYGNIAPLVKRWDEAAAGPCMVTAGDEDQIMVIHTNSTWLSWF